MIKNEMIPTILIILLVLLIGAVVVHLIRKSDETYEEVEHNMKNPRE